MSDEENGKNLVQTLVFVTVHLINESTKKKATTAFLIQIILIAVCLKCRLDMVSSTNIPEKSVYFGLRRNQIPKRYVFEMQTSPQQTDKAID